LGPYLSLLARACAVVRPVLARDDDDEEEEEEEEEEAWA
jgi:hypothetical protein